MGASFGSNGTSENEAPKYQSLYARNFLMSKILCAMARTAQRERKNTRSMGAMSLAITNPFGPCA
jgi:hypothetical protein